MVTPSVLFAGLPLNLGHRHRPQWVTPRTRHLRYRPTSLRSVDDAVVTYDDLVPRRHHVHRSGSADPRDVKLRLGPAWSTSDWTIEPLIIIEFLR